MICLFFKFGQILKFLHLLIARSPKNPMETLATPDGRRQFQGDTHGQSRMISIPLLWGLVPVVLRCGDLVYDRPSLILSSRRPPCWVTCLNDLCKRVPSRSWSALLSSVSWAPIDSICGMNAPHRSNTPETSCSPASMI